MKTDVEERLLLVITDDGDGNLPGSCGQYPCPLCLDILGSMGKRRNPSLSMDRRHPSTPSLSFAVPLILTIRRVSFVSGSAAVVQKRPRTCPVPRVGQGPLPHPTKAPRTLRGLSLGTPLGTGSVGGSSSSRGGRLRALPSVGGRARLRVGCGRCRQ